MKRIREREQEISIGLPRVSREELTNTKREEKKPRKKGEELGQRRNKRARGSNAP